ncbi:protein of unknown function (plasmid) [Cupriavidus taiwanensis]|uniref:Uncharacterized protein n=1 Tax=Cupriavidus taiwanensis TaxID=164546 RepID=A0A375I842_9BURK|nr:hypothetical protein CT19425_U450001 [Cupriavidus taiwanensis]SPK77679.1 protein of unknown function [Cupriavidus taiwanensis]
MRISPAPSTGKNGRGTFQLKNGQAAGDPAYRNQWLGWVQPLARCSHSKPGASLVDDGEALANARAILELLALSLSHAAPWHEELQCGGQVFSDRY